MKRFNILIEDTFVERTEITVAARDREQAKDLAGELIIMGDGEPSESYRQFEILSEEDEDDTDEEELG